MRYSQNAPRPWPHLVRVIEKRPQPSAVSVMGPVEPEPVGPPRVAGVAEHPNDPRVDRLDGPGAGARGPPDHPGRRSRLGSQRAECALGTDGNRRAVVHRRAGAAAASNISSNADLEVGDQRVVGRWSNRRWPADPSSSTGPIHWSLLVTKITTTGDATRYGDSANILSIAVVIVSVVIDPFNRPVATPAQAARIVSLA